MRIVVTGGAGFIGGNFVHHWLANHPEDQVVVVDALTYAGHLSTLASVQNNSNFSFVQADIRDKEAIAQVLQSGDTVVHFAAESHVDRSILDASSFVTTNVVGTHVLLEVAKEVGVKRFHHISTDEVFGALPLNTEDKFSENTPYDPRSPYSASKAGSDHLVRAYGETYGLPFTLTNCSNNYGPFHFPEKMIPQAITNIMLGKKVPIYGDGLYVRDWLYVIDHCRAIELVLLHGKVGETYCVGGMKKDVNNLELITMIAKLMGKDESVMEFVADRPGHDRRYSVDWTKINKELGWEPSVNLEAGLQQTIKWFEENRTWWEPFIL